MTNYGTIKLPRDEYEEHNERRKDMGLTWSEYVNGESPTPNGYNNAQLMDKLQELEATQGDTINAALSNDAETSGVDESALAEALADYLINGENLPEKVAGELR